MFEIDFKFEIRIFMWFIMHSMEGK